jgi:hypothetical protein
MRNVYTILGGRLKGKRPLGRPGSRSKWKDNFKMNLRETGWQGLDWIHPMRAKHPVYLVILTIFGEKLK